MDQAPGNMYYVRAVRDALSLSACLLMFITRVKVTGTLEAVDSDMQHMVLSDMQTALGVVPHASIRLSDVRRAPKSSISSC